MASSFIYFMRGDGAGIYALVVFVLSLIILVQLTSYIERLKDTMTQLRRVTLLILCALVFMASLGAIFLPTTLYVHGEVSHVLNMASDEGAYIIYSDKKVSKVGEDKSLFYLRAMDSAGDQRYKVLIYQGDERAEAPRFMREGAVLHVMHATRGATYMLETGERGRASAGEPPQIAAPASAPASWPAGWPTPAYVVPLGAQTLLVSEEGHVASLEVDGRLVWTVAPEALARWWGDGGSPRVHAVIPRAELVELWVSESRHTLHRVRLRRDDGQRIESQGF